MGRFEAALDRWFSALMALAMAVGLAAVWIASRLWEIDADTLAVLAATVVFASIGLVHGLGLRHGLRHWKPSCYHPRRSLRRRSPGARRR